MRCFPKADTYSWKMAYGFLGYHVLFWCIAFPCTLLNFSVFLLSILWITTISLLLLISVRLCGLKGIARLYRGLLSRFWEYRLYLIPCCILICFLIYYVSVNGQNDIDARTYIGEVTTRLDTDRLAGINVLTGSEDNYISWKRAFSMVGVNSAVLCKIFGIRPLVFCRTVRTAINILLLMVVSFEFFWWIYREQDHRFEDSIMAIMLSGAFLFLFTNTIYTPSSFILHRTYEGKAYCGGTLVLLLINLAVKLFDTDDCHYFFLVFMCMLTSMSICASSVFLLPVLAGSMVLAYILYSHKWKYILMLIAAMLPNIIYCAIYIMKIPGIPLK